MTISTAPTPLSYSGDGSTVAFPITWKYNAKSHIVATLRSSSGTETTWALTTNYTLTDPGDTGTLTAVVAPASGETLVISLEPPNTQSSDIPLGGEFPSVTVEDGLDLAAQRDQKIQSLFDRSLRVPRTDTKTGSALELPIDTSRANKYLAFDADGDPIASAAAAGTAVVSPFMETVLDDSTAAAARTTLGLGTAATVNTGTSGTTIPLNDGNNTQSGTLTMSGKSIIEANASIAAHATTMDPWSSGNYVTATGAAVTFTDLANAPQAGAEAEIYMNAAHIWTDNANLEVDGDANWTAEAGDRVLIRAKAVAGPFTIQPIKKTGKPIAGTTISGTAQATTSGTEWEYTSIPSWVTEIQCSVYGFSTNGSSLPIIQIGDSGGYEITGYSGSSGNYAGTASTSLYAGSGFELSPSVAAGEGRTGTITLTLADAASNTWVANGNLGRTDAGSISVTGGSKALSGVLDRVRLTMTNGTDVGDAGAFNILYK